VHDMKALLTDLYELTMAAGYWQAGKSAERATFELSIRRLPANRSYLLATGLEEALAYLLDLAFNPPEIDYLRSQPVFSQVSPGFWDYLSRFRFTGDVWAVGEGTPVFAGEPLLRISGPLPEAQIAETYLLSTITFQTLIATKAARIVEAAAGRGVVEFGTRRAHTPQAGVLGARAAYIGGCMGTSNVEAGYRFGIPVYGTAAHSWTQAFDSEPEAFCRLQQLLGDRTIYLLDTYDVEAGARNAAAVGQPFLGVRLDSGDLEAQSRLVRRILDDAGYREARIMASGDLNEQRIAALVRAGAPIDWFGAGTELATSADAPHLASIYKLVEIERGGQPRPTAKRSADKPSWPGIKQVFRGPGYDIVGLECESFAGAAPLLEPVVERGRRVAEPPALSQIRGRARAQLAELPAACRRLENPEPYPVRYSEKLQALCAQLGASR